LDLTKAEVKKDESHSSKINITETIILEMRYPKFEEMLGIYQNFKSENIVDLLCNCIKAVYTEEQVYEDYTKDELTEFVNGFSKTQFSLLENFFFQYFTKLVKYFLILEIAKLYFPLIC
jgi:hypothetical protein